MFDIQPLDLSLLTLIRDKINQKTKPPGSLGRIEALAEQIALIQNKPKLSLNCPRLIVFAADHGIAEEGVSIAPSEVTNQMVLNFLAGGAAINCFSRANGIELRVVDAGTLTPATDSEALISKRLGNGTQNFSKQAAMTMDQVKLGLQYGAEVVNDVVHQGCEVIGFGEMGIGNTSSAAAIMAAITQLEVSDCVGRGTGIDDDSYQKKLSLVEQALELHKDSLTDPLQILACVGGFEIVQMVGAMLEAARKRVIILVDGFIATAAALVAQAINDNVADYMVFCHQSNERGHHLMLEHLQADPLLQLEMRLGEGTGAALALPLLRCAVSFYNDMASFADAGIEQV